MTNLNLYDIYDKSLADLNRDYQDELREYDYDEAIELPTQRKPITIVFSIFLMLASLVASGYYLFSNRIIPIPQIIVRGIDTRSPEEMQGYVRVQIFNFDDNSSVEELLIAEAIMPDNLTSDNITTLAQAQAPVLTIEEQDAKDLSIKREDVYRTKAVEVQAMQDPLEGKVPENADDIKIVAIDKDHKTPIADYPKSGDTTYTEALRAEQNRTKRAPQKPQSAPAVATVSSSYYILFENLNEVQFRRVNDIMGTSSLQATADALTSVQPVWRVYQIDEEEGNITIGGNKVTFLSEFTTSSDANEFAEYINDGITQVIIRTEDKPSKNYNVKICCTDIDEAKTIAQASNIRDKIIKIVNIK